MKSTLIALAGATALMLGWTPAAHVQSAGLTLLLFPFGPAHGLLPNVVTADKQGTEFGMTLLGGTGDCQIGPGCGTVFSLAPPQAGGGAWIFHRLYDFTGGRDGSGSPTPLTVAANGTLYGYTVVPSQATIFSLTPPANVGRPWAFKILHVFHGNFEGGLGGLQTPLIYRHGALYGIAVGGSGACGQIGCGSVFGLTPNPRGGEWTLKTLFSFTGGAASGEPDWIAGFGDVGPLYVCTSLGNGAVVAITPPRSGGVWTERVITTFAGGDDGQAPGNLVPSPDGKLYGLAIASGADVVFQLSPPASAASPWARTTIGSVSDQGYGPTSLAQGSDGSLIGAIYGDVDLFPGGIFQFTPPASGGAWKYSLVWNFHDHPGRNPLNVVTGAEGTLLGALDGGDSSDGYAFALRRR